MEEILEKVKALFSQKNESYGQDQDLFHNFRKTAKRVMQAKFDSEYEDMYRVMLAYQDKHRVALANLGLDEPEFEERCLDEIVYTLLAIALHREYESSFWSLVENETPEVKGVARCECPWKGTDEECPECWKPCPGGGISGKVDDACQGCEDLRTGDEGE
jgi:hypothetical protein